MNTYDIGTDPIRLQPAAIHAYLTRGCWSPGIPKEVVERVRTCRNCGASCMRRETRGTRMAPAGLNGAAPAPGVSCSTRAWPESK